MKLTISAGTVILLSVFIFSLFITPLYGQDKSLEMIAVINFENTSGSPALNHLNETISEHIYTYLQKTGRLNLVERGRLKEASLNELNLSITDIIDDTTSAKLGRLVGAKFSVIGSFTKIGDTYQINARLIDVETAKAIPGAAVQERGKEDELFNLLDKIAESLKKVILKGKEISLGK